MDSNQAAGSAAGAGKGAGSTLPAGAIVVVVVVVIAVVAAAALLFTGNSGGPGSTGGNGSGTDVIAQAFSSGQALTGAQLANITEQYSKTVGPLNVTYMVNTHATSSSPNFTDTTAGVLDEDYQRANGDFRADIMMSALANMHSPYYSNNVSTKTQAVVISFSNGTSYGCNKVLNITPPDPQLSKNFTCYKGIYSNNTLFNFSNPFGSTPYVKYRLVGKSSVLGIPCDILSGNGTLSTPASLALNTTVNVRTCVSYKYLAWLNYSIDTIEHQSAHGLLSNSSSSGIATALNNRVSANLTQLPPGAIILP